MSKLTVTPAKKIQEDITALSNLEKCFCCCFSTCSCDKLLFECDCCDLCEDSQMFIKKHVRKIQSLGVKGIYKSLRNIYTETPIGSTVKEVCVWGLFISFLILFQKSFALLIKNKVTGNDSYDYWFKLLATIFSGTGLLFSLFDTFFHAYHHRFKTCKEWKKWRQNNVNNDRSCCLRCLCCKRNDPNHVNVGSVEIEINDGHQSDNLTAEEVTMCCPKSVTTLIDIFRVLFAETLFYLSLTLSVFELCTELVINNNDPHMIKGTTWFGFIFSFFSTLCLVYIPRVFILTGTVYSVAKIRGKENIFKGAIFQVMFALYSYGLMALQMCMIVAIGGAYYNEYSERYIEASALVNISNASSVNHTALLLMNVSNASSGNYNTPPTVNINYSPSGQMWYVIVCGYVTPILGIIMFFVVCHYWTQQFPIEVVLDIFESLKSSMKKAVLLKKLGKEYVETLEKLSKHLNKNNHKLIDYCVIRNLNFCYKFSYPFKRLAHIILCSLYIAMLIGFFACCVIIGSGRAWILYYISVLVFGLIVNWYVFLVALFWPVTLVVVLVGIASILIAILVASAVILAVIIAILGAIIAILVSFGVIIIPLALCLGTMAG